MPNLTCLSEIEEPYNFHSSLNCHEKQLPNIVYCVLSENYFVIFKRPTEFISLKRIPITRDTKLEFTNNQFSILVNDYKFTFSSDNTILIKNWTSHITKVIGNSIDGKFSNEFNRTDVKIEQLGNQTLYILVGNNDYKLYIYESPIYSHPDIALHIINFKFYTIENLLVRRMTNSSKLSSSKLCLAGANGKFKFTFKDEGCLSSWKSIFLKAINAAFTPIENSVLTAIYANKSNMVCADCGYSNPEWVSTNLCVAVCINCAGFHRSLGTSVSRIKSAIIDQCIWKDSNLVTIFQLIGNERANSFWLKNKQKNYVISNDEPIFIKDKYEKKIFVDIEFANLTETEIKNELSNSVKTDDVFLTMRLWHSINFQYDGEFISELIAVAREHKKALQEKFLSLQPHSRNPDIQDPTILTNVVLQIAHNNTDKSNNLFLVSISNSCINIKVETPNVYPVEIVSVCCVYFHDIDLAWYNADKESLEISINLSCSFLKQTGHRKSSQSVNVHQISFFSQSKSILQNFKIQLMKALLSENSVPITVESNMFFCSEVQTNKEIAVKCIGLLTNHELWLCDPVSRVVYLKNCRIVDSNEDQTVVSIKFENEQFKLMTRNLDHQNIIHRCLESASKCMKLTKEGDLIPVALDRMIQFISFYGLRSVGIFRMGGMIRKVNTLFHLVNTMKKDFFIDPINFSVDDVASCMKKYLRSLDEPIITEKLFKSFYEASQMTSVNKKLEKYKLLISEIPNLNRKILRRIMELFLMIQLRVEENKMDSSNLAISTASSLISFDSNNSHSNLVIMKDLIDHFLVLFNYTDEEFRILKLFVENPGPINQSVIRTFYVNPNLNSMMTIRSTDTEKISFLDQEKNYLVVQVCDIEKCAVGDDFCLKIFTNTSVELWHFLNKSSNFYSKTIKRLVYFNDDMQSSILHSRTMGGYKNNYFVFLPKENNGKSEKSHSFFQCDVKLKSDRYQDFSLRMQKNSLDLLENRTKSSDLVYNFVLSDVAVYRFHTKNFNKIFILHGTNGCLKCKFHKNDDLQDFLYYYDQYRSSSSNAE